MSTEEDGTRCLYTVFEGRLGGQYVAVSLHAGMHETSESLERASQLGIRALEARYPGVEGAWQMIPWTETVLPDVEDETTEETK